jgi:hypothetical protein
MLLASRETVKMIPGLKELLPYWTSASGARLLEHLLGESSDSEALPEEIRPLFDELSFRKEISFPKEDVERIPERLGIGVRELGAIILRDKLSRLADEIQEAEGRGDHERTAGLLEEFRLNSQRLSDLLNPVPVAS